MQRTRIDRRRIIILIVSIAILVFSIGIDLLTKVLFKNLFLKQGKTVVIENFFYFSGTGIKPDARKKITKETKPVLPDKYRESG